jgi:dTDP-4-dehydrorhamnose reductase
MKILITGANGYLGKSLYNIFKNKYETVVITRQDFNLTDTKATTEFFSNKYFDVILHCAVAGGSRLKQDSWEIMDINLSMYYNLLQCHTHYNKLINFGSGAELHMNNTPYGLSKHVIRQSLLEKENFYNLRIFSVFDENELDTRFIKANIKNYINQRPIVIHQNKCMSFFYMKDLIKIVEYYMLQNTNLQKEFNCVYSHIHTLEAVANVINTLANYQVEIIQNTLGMKEGYYGDNLWRPNIEYIGLEQGIKEVYNKLKNEY